MLRDLSSRFAQKEQEWSSVEATMQKMQQIAVQQQSQIAKMEQENERLRSQVGNQIAKMEQESERLKSNFEQQGRNTEELKTVTAQMKRETAQTVSALQSQSAQIQSELTSQKKNTEQLKKELKRETADKIDEFNKSIKTSKDPLGAIRTLEGDFKNLRVMLQRKGLFTPPITIINNYPPEVVAARPPVGTIELGQDVFTARLLLRLGFMKGRYEQKLESEDDAPSSDSDEAGFYNTEADGNVTGIVVPEIEVGTRAYFQVTRGWLSICILVAFLQFLSLAVIVLAKGLGGGECFHRDRTGLEWWTLHLSKGAAMLVASGLMAERLMDVVCYLMVAELLLKVRSAEVIITAVVRAALAIVILSTQVVMLRWLKDPSDVWMNMTAFAFIGNLAVDSLTLSKRGVFGNEIQKVMTNMSFQLCLTELYPPWFHAAKVFALSVCGASIVIFSFLGFLLPDPTCEE